MVDYPEFICECIKKVREIMIEYQKERGIKAKCVENSYLFREIMREMKIPCDVKSVVAVCYKTDEENRVEETAFVTHMIVRMFDDVCCDVSHETFKYDDKSYFDNFKDVIDEYNDHSEQYFKQHNKKHPDELDLRGMLKTFLDFKKYADDINSGGTINKSDYYYEQEKHIHTEMNKFVASL